MLACYLLADLTESGNFVVFPLSIDLEISFSIQMHWHLFNTSGTIDFLYLSNCISLSFYINSRKSISFKFYRKLIILLILRESKVKYSTDYCILLIKRINLNVISDLKFLNKISVSYIRLIDLDSGYL